MWVYTHGLLTYPAWVHHHLAVAVVHHLIRPSGGQRKAHHEERVRENL